MVPQPSNIRTNRATTLHLDCEPSAQRSVWLLSQYLLSIKLLSIKLDVSVLASAEGRFGSIRYFGSSLNKTPAHRDRANYIKFLFYHLNTVCRSPCTEAHIRAIYMHTQPDPRLLRCMNALADRTCGQPPLLCLKQNCYRPEADDSSRHCLSILIQPYPIS